MNDELKAKVEAGVETYYQEQLECGELNSRHMDNLDQAFRRGSEFLYSLLTQSQGAFDEKAVVEVKARHLESLLELMPLSGGGLTTNQLIELATKFHNEGFERGNDWQQSQTKAKLGALNFDQIEWLRAFYERSTGLRAQDIDVNEPEFVDFDFGG